MLERRSPPTFDVLIEIQHRDQIAVHPDVSDAVDALLRGTPLQPEVRSRTAEGEISIETPTPQKATARRTALSQVGGPRRNNGGKYEGGGRRVSERFIQAAERSSRRQALEPLKIYPYGVARNRLANAAKRLGVPIVITKDVSEADVLVTLRSHYRKRQRTVMNAEQRGMPVYVLRSNTVTQMEQFLSNLFELRLEEPGSRNSDVALEEAERAIAAVLNGERWVELPSASSYIRRIQHQMAQEAQLVSHSYGKEPNRRVRIFRE